MPGYGDDLRNDNAVEAGALRYYFVHFVSRHGQAMTECSSIQVRINPFSQPRFDNLHGRYLNCRRNRKSFSKNVRRSVTL